MKPQELEKTTVVTGSEEMKVEGTHRRSLPAGARRGRAEGREAGEGRLRRGACVSRGGV